MINIALPDGSIKVFENNVTGLEVARSIGEGLAKAALAIEVNGIEQDLSDEITRDANVKIITGKTDAGLEIIRHDTAHILAQSVKELWPDAQITIGPAIEDGFYYDILKEPPLHLDDLALIENKMKENIAKGFVFEKEIWTRQQAIAYFKSIGEHYKVELIEAIAENEDIKIYKQGDFIDLCRGPHAPTTASPKAFKLLKLAGAYWRGNSKNQMLQRIYGTAWETEKQLKEYLFRLEEAEKRDHRKLGKELDLFHMQEEAPGQVFWHDKGWTIYRIIENYIRDKIRKNGYTEVKTPILADRSIWEASGHWDKFGENMFTVKDDEHIYAMKPMNCPLHIQIFKQHLKSYRDLPLRMAEFGCCHRNESSGSMHGIMRVRGFVQDDAHIFCTPEQVTEETLKFTNLLKEVYKDFGFEEIRVKFSTRPPVRAGTDEVWNQAEEALRVATKSMGLEYEINEGEGAFYGPKLEFVLKDAIGRDWQCGTLQVDYILPERLDATYIGPDGHKHRPVMVHRAILGSLERFIGILIENFEGKFPLWLSPIQVMITTITSDNNNYAVKVKEELLKAGIRAEVDLSADKITYKIREHSLKKIPIILTVGKKEEETGTVSVRRLGSDIQTTLSVDQFINKLNTETTLKL